MDFFKAKRRPELKITRLEQGETWGIDKPIYFFKTNWSDSYKIGLQELQKEADVLLCIAPMKRRRPDVEIIQKQDVQFTFMEIC